MGLRTGEKIREFREKIGLSQKEFADKIGISEKTLRRYEKGETGIKFEILEKIAKTYGISVSDLADSESSNQTGQTNISNSDVELNSTKSRRSFRKIDPILGRIKQVLKAKSDKEMCEKWGINYSTLDTWKSKDKIPEKRLLDFSLKNGVSLDWLLTGNGEPFPSKNINKGIIGIGGVGDNHNYKVDIADNQNNQQVINDLPPDVQVILDELLHLTKEQRKEVLKFIFKLQEEE